MNKQELVAKIKQCNKEYWEENAPSITDDEYDRLIQQLRTIDPNNKEIFAIGSSSVVDKVKHETPLLSLNKAYSLEEVKKWMQTVSDSSEELFLVQPKYDGMTAKYDTKNFCLSTRGDGYMGENITHVLPIVKVVSRTQQSPIVGELVLTKSEFEYLKQSISKKDGSSYSTARNAVAGIVSSKSIKEYCEKGIYLTLMTFDAVEFKYTAEQVANNWLELLDSISALEIPIDGMVIKLADTNKYEKLGCTSHHPRGAIAFKFANIRAESVLRDVEWSHGRYALTPVAIFDPVKIGGVTISRANLHNLNNIRDKDIQIGDRIVVERAGDVIPDIVSSTPGETRSVIDITHCPFCNTKIGKFAGNVVCTNPNCSETIVRQLINGAGVLGIDGLGVATMTQLVQLGITELSELFSLDVETLTNLDGFASKAAENLYHAIQKVTDGVEDYHLLASIGIAQLGVTTAKKLCAQYSLDELVKANADDLMKVPSIGFEKAHIIEAGLKEKQTEIELLQRIIHVNSASNSNSLPTICFTGKMDKPRSYYEQMARDKGWIPVDKVTESLELLVAADTSDNTTKLMRAKKLGVSISSLTGWLESRSRLPEMHMIKTIQDEVKKRLGLDSDCHYDADDVQYCLRLFNIDADDVPRLTQQIDDLANELFPYDSEAICSQLYNKAETLRFFPKHAIVT